MCGGGVGVGVHAATDVGEEQRLKNEKNRGRRKEQREISGDRRSVRAQHVTLAGRHRRTVGFCAAHGVVGQPAKGPLALSL